MKELNKLGALAFRVGCPQEQMTRFLSAGYIPQAKGLQFHAYAREADRLGGPTDIAMGGTRGTAKSHAQFAQAVIDDLTRVDGLKFLYLRKLQKKADESFGDLRRKVLQFTPHTFKNSNLYLPNGSFMVMGGFRSESEIDAYLGQEYDGAIIEDATVLSKSKADSIKASVRTSRDDWRPRTYHSFNPGGIGHAWAKRMFYDPWKRNAETDTRFIQMQPGDNQFINPEYEPQLRKLSGWLYRAWYLGDMEISAGQFFINWDENVHVIEPRELVYDWKFWCAMDYGFTHWLVVYLFAKDGEGNIYVIDEHAERRWLASQHVPAIKAMLGRNGLNFSHLDTFVAGHDVFAQRGTTQTIAEEYQQLGIKLARADIDRINGAARILSLLGNEHYPSQLFVFNRCRKLIDTLPLMETNPNRPEDVLKIDCNADTGEGGDDPYDTLRYGVMATKEYPKPGVAHYA